MKRHARSGMFMMAAVMAAMMAIVVAVASPYAPVVQACIPIETVWAVEDARTPTEELLVTALNCNGSPLAYDADSRTFYCTLGIENEEEWPRIHLTAPGAEGVNIVFLDDYTYDWCCDAIAGGYAYELMAYTDTEYTYFNLVFTGLPQLCIDTPGIEITDEDTQIRFSMAEYGKEALESTGRMRLRGASTRLNDKKGYKIEFTRQRYDGEKKTELETPVLGMANEVVLLPCAGDDTRMRDKLGWDLYAELAGEDESFGVRRTEYVEVFQDDAYLGLYLMMEPVDEEAELKLSGDTCLMTDSVYRTATMAFADGREALTNPLCSEIGYELYYAPQGAEPFADLEPYMNLMLAQEDEAFSELAGLHVDTDTLLRHVILIQAGGMTDNVFNNMYIWAHEQNGTVRYRHSCWDMDWSWGFKQEEIGEEYENWIYFPIADRMLNLNVDGLRQRLYETWTDLRAAVLTEQWLEERIAEYNTMLRDSGALEREEKRWEFEAADGYEIVIFASARWWILDDAIADMAENPDKALPYLTSSRYGSEKGASML